MLGIRLVGAPRYFAVRQFKQFHAMPSDDSSASNSDKTNAPPLKALAGEKTGALAPSDSVATAAERMRELDTESLPVAEDRKLVGVIEEKNPDIAIAAKGHDPHTWSVGEIMNRDAVFCYEDEDCEAAKRTMEERGLDYLPVVDRHMRIVAIFEREELTRKTDQMR